MNGETGMGKHIIAALGAALLLCGGLAPLASHAADKTDAPLDYLRAPLPPGAAKYGAIVLIASTVIKPLVTNTFFKSSLQASIAVS